MIEQWVETLEAWILAMSESIWVFPSLYAFATIDGFFPPIPSESVVIALGSLNRSTGVPNLGLVLLFASLGAFTGDQIAYQIGSKINVRRLRFMRSDRAQAALDWAERSLEKRGASFIIAARYVPIGRVAVNMTAGAVGYHRPRFVGLTAFAAVTWACYSALIGIASGSLLQGRPVLAIIVGVIGGVIIGFIVDRVISWFSHRADKRAAVGDAREPDDGEPDDGEPDDGEPDDGEPDDGEPDGTNGPDGGSLASGALPGNAVTPDEEASAP